MSAASRFRDWFAQRDSACKDVIDAMEILEKGSQMATAKAYQDLVAMMDAHEAFRVSLLAAVNAYQSVKLGKLPVGEELDAGWTDEPTTPATPAALKPKGPVN